MNDGFRRREWANVGGFVKERLKRAPTDFEHTRLECLYAHYRKWAFFRGEAPVSEPVFCHRLEAATKLSPYDFRGHRMYAAMILDVEPKVDEQEPEERAEVKRIVKGQVRAKRNFSFLDEAVSVGQLLDWMEPMPHEKDRLKQAAVERTGKPSASWLVIEFAGKRRYVCSENVEKVH